METLYKILEILIILVPVLMTVAFVTIAERKIMASMQRRCGPNAVGIWGILQPSNVSGIKKIRNNNIFSFYRKIRLNVGTISYMKLINRNLQFIT